MEAAAMMKCPLCSCAAQDGTEECSSCGAIFAKLRARAEREKALATQVLAPSERPRLNQWHVRVAALTLVVGWMIGLGLYYRIELARLPQRGKFIAVQGRSSVTVRDSYGLIGEVPVATARPGSTRSEEAPPPPEPEPVNSKPDPFDE